MKLVRSLLVDLGVDVVGVLPYDMVFQEIFAGRLVALNLEMLVRVERMIEFQLAGDRGPRCRRADGFEVGGIQCWL